ncbi:MAG TPA: protocatechuate 3,4-dioxygenase subunit alpha [Terrimesophilobacter sp.]|nr:protocatechuate 3,4-dioxygenase subunit alpha [Terrimesophilobacter sp.]
MVELPPSASGRILRSTPGQTIGPFFAFGLGFPKMNEIAAPHSPGSTILRGRVYDGDGAPVPDAMIEIFGADRDGTIPGARGSLNRDSHTFTGFGRVFTDDEGQWMFWTREPGGNGRAARFFAVMLFARGLTDRLRTRIYLPGEGSGLDADPLLVALNEQERTTLIATRQPDGTLHHDLWLQGEKETVFLDC